VSPRVEDAAVPVAPYETYRAGLDAGRLTFQRCRACGDAWLPPREECPHCWSPDWDWEEASGKATVVSWVVYHTAFDKRFAGRLPYNVAVVELDEGPRMITNIVEIPADGDVIGRKAVLAFEMDHDRLLPRYRLDPGASREGGGRKLEKNQGRNE
jgi:uncharacterized OB-fold protein